MSLVLYNFVLEYLMQDINSCHYLIAKTIALPSHFVHDFQWHLSKH